MTGAPTSLNPVRAFFATVVMGIGTAVAACGEADSAMSDPAPCTASTSTPVTAAGRRDPLRAFTQGINQDASRMEKLTDDFRRRYPNGRFYRGSFRPDFGRYADETVCIAIAMRELTLPAAFASTEAALDSAIDGFIEHQRAGREAVRSRNVSGYKDWNRGIDIQLAALRVSTVVSP